MLLNQAALQSLEHKSNQGQPKEASAPSISKYKSSSSFHNVESQRGLILWDRTSIKQSSHSKNTCSKLMEYERKRRNASNG